MEQQQVVYVVQQPQPQNIVYVQQTPNQQQQQNVIYIQQPVQEAVISQPGDPTLAVNKVNEFNKFVVFIDSKGPVQSLEEMKRTEQLKLGENKKMRKCSIICTLSSLFAIIIGVILIIVFGVGVAIFIIFFGVCCICICIPCYIHNSNRGYLNSVYTFNQRKALQFDVSGQCVKRIVFSTDYGLNRKARNKQHRDDCLHEPIVEIVSITQVICGFNQISGIGKKDKISWW